MMPAASRRFNVAVSSLSVVASFILCVVWVASQIQGIPGTAVRYAISFALLESAVMVVMVAGIVAAKSSRARAEQIAGQRRKAIQDLLILGRDSSAFDQVAREWPAELLEVADEALGFLMGAERQRILKLIEIPACRSMLLRAVKSDEPREATRAVRILSECETEDCRAAVVGAMDHPSTVVRAAASKAALKTGDANLKLRILATIPKVPLWERVVMFHSVYFDTEVVQRFIEDALAGSDDELKIAALDLVHAGRRFVSAPVPPKLAASVNVEVRIKFFKALPYCRLPEDSLALLGAGLQDPDWRVRAMAAKACTQLRPAPLAPNLLALFRNATQPAEIRHAAQALAAMGGESQLQLERLAGAGHGITSQIAAEVVEQRIIALMGARK